MPHPLSRRHLQDDEILARIRALSPSFFDKLGIPLGRLAEAQVKLVGNIVFPDDPSYQADRKLWNPFFDPYPAIIIHCHGENDVRIALELGRDYDLPVTIRSGGHTTAGYSGGDGGLLIDVSPINDIHVDTDRLIATVSCGTNFGKLNAALQARGVHLPAGECDDVCMGGFMQGGGFGFTSRTFGIHCDNVISIRVMLADGRIVTADEKVNSDLWWAVRGGTGGNFGVLLSADYRLRKLGNVYGWSVLWPLTRPNQRATAAAALDEIERQYFGAAPPEFNLQISVCYQPPAPGLDAEPQLLVRGLYVGPDSAGRAAIEAICNLPGAVFQYDVHADFITVDNMLLNQPFGIPYIPFDKGMPKEDKQARYVARDLAEAEWQKILDHFVTSPNKWSYLYFEVYGGAINAYPVEASAFIHRDVAFCAALDVFFFPEDDRAATEQFLRDWCAMIEPMWNGHIYQNYPKSDVPDYRKHYWGRALDALIGVKNKYDPDGFFRFEQMISPYPDEPPKPATWPPKVAQALTQPIMFEDGKS